MGGETTKNRVLNVLLLEDNPADARLTIHKLRESGFDIHAEVSRNSEEFERLLQSRPRDLILGDYRLPNWTGLDAIRWVRESGFTLPFVLVTGTLGDELAIECIKAGADDYVLKDNLDRLPIVVKRVLAEHEMRLERDRAEHELREAEEQYRLLFQASPHPMWVFDNNTLRFLAVNNAAIRHYGYSAKEFFSMSVADIRPSQDVERFLQSMERQRHEHSVESYTELWKHKKRMERSSMWKSTFSQYDFVASMHSWSWLMMLRTVLPWSASFGRLRRWRRSVVWREELHMTLTIS